MVGSGEILRPRSADIFQFFLVSRGRLHITAPLVHGKKVEKARGQKPTTFRAVTWDLDPKTRTLIGYYNDVGEANSAARYDIPANRARVAGRRRSTSTPDSLKSLPPGSDSNPGACFHDGYSNGLI